MFNSFFTIIKTCTRFPASTTRFQRFARQKTAADTALGDTPLPWAQKGTVSKVGGEPQENPDDGEGLVFDLSEPEPPPAPVPSAKLQRRSTRQAQNVEEGETI